MICSFYSYLTVVLIKHFCYVLIDFYDINRQIVVFNSLLNIYLIYEYLVVYSHKNLEREKI